MRDDFSNAKRYLCVDYRSISGLEIEPEWAVWFELYRDAFVAELESQGFTSDSDFARLLSDMDEYNDVGSFLGDPDEQRADMAAYGLIVFDRILRAEAAKVDHFSVFCMHQELMECYGFALKDHYLSGVIRKQKLAFKAIGLNGLKSRHGRFKGLRNWALNIAATMKGSDVQIADQLEVLAPKEFTHDESGKIKISDPRRIIYEALLKSHKK